MKEHVTATCATIPERLTALHDAAVSLLPQVDELRVYLNRFERVPRVLDRPGITPILGRDAAGDLGDAGKFYGAERIEGYHLTVDDDLIYPPDYVSRTIEAIEQYDGEALVSWHGKRLLGRITSYARDRRNMRRFCFWEGLEQNAPIDVPGTGCAGYWTDCIRFTLDDFETDNRADLHAAHACARRGVAIVCPARSVGWIRRSPRVDHNRSSLWARVRADDSTETRLANELLRPTPEPAGP